MSKIEAIHDETGIMEKNHPKPGSVKAEGITAKSLPPNLAKDETITKNAEVYIKERFSRFATQEMRRTLMKEDGTFSQIDKMLRLSLSRNESSKQFIETYSTVASECYRVAMLKRHAVVCDILFTGNELPGKFESDVNTLEYDNVSESEDVNRQRNMMEMHTYDEDKRIPKWKKHLWWVENYGAGLFIHDWDYRVIEAEENVPDKKGSYVKKKTKRVIADHPTLFSPDIADVYLDSTISDIKDQRCVIIKQTKPYEDLLALAADKNQWITNVDKIDVSAAYQGETDLGDNAKKERTDNSGMSVTLDKNGMIKCYLCYVKLPIKENGDKGTWSPKETPAVWYRTRWAGSMNGEMICLEMRRVDRVNFPLLWLTAEQDNRGAYPAGCGEIVMELYLQNCTFLDMAIDNCDKANLAPTLADGPVYKSNPKFRPAGNQFFRIAPGAKVQQLQIRDTTGITIQMREKINEAIEKALGIYKFGEHFGSRTSALEAGQVRNENMLPLDEHVDSLANQLVEWEFCCDEEAWRKYGDPNRILSVSNANLIQPIQPTYWYGPVKTKVTCMERFRSDIARRRELNGLLASGYQVLIQRLQAANPEAAMSLDRKILEGLGFKEEARMLRHKTDPGAVYKAANESHNILSLGIPDDVDPDDNHPVHKPIHQSFLEAYQRLPKEQQDETLIGLMEEHIGKHEAFEQQEALAGQMGQMAGPSKSVTTAEQEMDITEGQMGALANL